MSGRSWTSQKVYEVPCTVEIEHTSSSLHAHVSLEGDFDIGPGDKVRVLGTPVDISYGQKFTLRRQAQVTLAPPLARLWTKLLARFELAELYEVSFTDRRTL